MFNKIALKTKLNDKNQIQRFFSIVSEDYLCIIFVLRWIIHELRIFVLD